MLLSDKLMFSFTLRLGAIGLTKAFLQTQLSPHTRRWVYISIPNFCNAKPGRFQTMMLWNKFWRFAVELSRNLPAVLCFHNFAIILTLRYIYIYISATSLHKGDAAKSERKVFYQENSPVGFCLRFTGVKMRIWREIDFQAKHCGCHVYTANVWRKLWMDGW